MVLSRDLLSSLLVLPVVFFSLAFSLLLFALDLARASVLSASLAFDNTLSARVRWLALSLLLVLALLLLVLVLVMVVALTRFFSLVLLLLEDEDDEDDDENDDDDDDDEDEWLTKKSDNDCANNS